MVKLPTVLHGQMFKKKGRCNYFNAKYMIFEPSIFYYNKKICKKNYISDYKNRYNYIGSTTCFIVTLCDLLWLFIKKKKKIIFLKIKIIIDHRVELWLLSSNPATGTLDRINIGYGFFSVHMRIIHYKYTHYIK